MKTKNTVLSMTIMIWAVLIGAVMYSHIAFFPAFLHHLPESTSLISGPYGINDEPFWKTIHPLLVVSLLLSLIFNRKLVARRRFIVLALVIYVTILVITFLYFVPELQAFIHSKDSSITTQEWLRRGKQWEQFSWIRGSFLMAGFIMLLQALIKTD